MVVTSAGVAAVPGITASISEEGYLCLSYMGTDPPSQVVSTTKAALNYDNMDEEHRRLLTVIRRLLTREVSLQVFSSSYDMYPPPHTLTREVSLQVFSSSYDMYPPPHTLTREVSLQIASFYAPKRQAV